MLLFLLEFLYVILMIIILIWLFLDWFIVNGSNLWFKGILLNYEIIFVMNIIIFVLDNGFFFFLYKVCLVIEL